MDKSSDNIETPKITETKEITETINFLNYQFPVTLQAKLVYNTWVVALFAFLLSSLFIKMSVVQLLFMTFMIIFTAIISIYVANCVVVGKCYTYSWALVALSSLNAFIYIITFILSVLDSSNRISTKSLFAKKSGKK